MNFFSGKQFRSEQVLLKRAVAGDSGASKEVIGLLSTRAYSLAWKMMGNKEDAEDVVQEAFIRLWKSAAAFTGRSALFTYFYVIVSNLCLDRLRANSKSGFDEFDEAEYLPETSVDFDDGADPSAIQSAINVLSVKQRMAILMWTYQDLTAAEIGRTMGMNKNSVDQLLYRAKLKLKSELEKGDSHENQ